jgi:hypothetical protein
MWFIVVIEDKKDKKDKKGTGTKRGLRGGVEKVRF